MRHKHSDEQAYAEDLAREETDYADPAEAALSEVEEDAFSYADEDHTDEDDISEEHTEPGKGSIAQSL